MTNEIEPGYYWAYVYYPSQKKTDLEIVEWRWYNKLDFEDGDDEYNPTLTKEYEWLLCGSEVPVWPHDRIKLVDGVRLTPPPDPVIFAEIKALDPQPAAVAMVEHIHPVRDNGT